MLEIQVFRERDTPNGNMNDFHTRSFMQPRNFDLEFPARAKVDLSEVFEEIAFPAEEGHEEDESITVARPHITKSRLSEIEESKDAAKKPSIRVGPPGHSHRHSLGFSESRRSS